MIASIIRALRANPTKKLTGEELYDLMADAADKPSVYQTLTQYARPPHNLLKREKPVGEVHFRYWIDAATKIPNNVEDMLLRDEARSRQAAGDTTVQDRKKNGATAPQAPPIARSGPEVQRATPAASTPASAESAPPGKSTESDHRLPGQPAAPPDTLIVKAAQIDPRTVTTHTPVRPRTTPAPDALVRVDTTDAYQVVLLDIELRVKRMIEERDQVEMQIAVAQARRADVVSAIVQAHAAAEALRALIR